jgi:hypothetical protein
VSGVFRGTIEVRRAITIRMAKVDLLGTGTGGGRKEEVAVS